MRYGSKAHVRILDFDFECRPLSWYAGDWNSKELTAIAWKFIGEGDPVEVRLLGEGSDPCPCCAQPRHRTSVAEMLRDFLEAYDAADVVTGHFIKAFDLPMLVAACLEEGFPVPRAKRAQDTKIDMVRFSGLSKSQEALGAMFELAHPKVGMSQTDWRVANRLLAEGLERTRARVAGDVEQHIELRAALLRRGALRTPSPWSPGSAKPEKYHP